MIRRVWEVSSGDCIRTLEGHSSRVTALSWSSDGSRICSGSEDHTMRVWDVSSGQCLHTTVFENFRFASLGFSLRFISHSFFFVCDISRQFFFCSRLVGSWLELAAVWFLMESRVSRSLCCEGRVIHFLRRVGGLETRERESCLDFACGYISSEALATPSGGLKSNSVILTFERPLLWRRRRKTFCLTSKAALSLSERLGHREEKEKRTRDERREREAREKREREDILIWKHEKFSV